MGTLRPTTDLRRRRAGGLAGGAAVLLAVLIAVVVEIEGSMTELEKSARCPGMYSDSYKNLHNTKCQNNGFVDGRTCSCVCKKGYSGKYCQANIISVGPEAIGKVPLKKRPKQENSNFEFTSKKMIVVGRLPPSSYEKTTVYEEKLKLDDPVVRTSLSRPVFQVGDTVKWTNDRVFLDDYAGPVSTAKVVAVGVCKNSKMRMGMGEPPWIRVLIVLPDTTAKSAINQNGVLTGKAELEAVTETRSRAGPMSWQDSWAAVKWFNHDPSVTACEGVVYDPADNKGTPCPLGCSGNGICKAAEKKCFCYSLWEGCGCERGSKKLLMEIIMGVENSFNDIKQETGASQYGNMTGDGESDWAKELASYGYKDGESTWDDEMGLKMYGEDYNRVGTWAYLVGVVERMAELVNQQKEHDQERAKRAILGTSNLISTLQQMSVMIDTTFGEHAGKNPEDMKEDDDPSGVRAALKAFEIKIQKDMASTS